MSLAMGTAPFGQQRGGAFNFDTGVLRPHTLYVEDSPKRVRVKFAGQTVADSRRVKLLHETGLLPVYYFPEADVRADLLAPTDHQTHCPFKGDAAYRSVRVGERVAENAVWTYPNPTDESPLSAGYHAFYWDRMDAWYEEDEEVFVHPRDPYHRIDVLQSSRRVRVRVGGEVVAETERPKMLLETGLPTRYYIPPVDVRTERLRPSETTSLCPYKGKASYQSVEAGGAVAEDVAWYYPETLRDAEGVAGYFCFFNEKVDLEVDGEMLERPKTKWS